MTSNLVCFWVGTRTTLPRLLVKEGLGPVLGCWVEVLTWENRSVEEEEEGIKSSGAPKVKVERREDSSSSKGSVWAVRVPDTAERSADTGD